LATGRVSEALLGEWVTVEARIERATLLSAGVKFVVDDGSGPAVVWMHQELYAQLVDPASWNVGAVARVTGRVSEYEGELEVVPAKIEDVVIVLFAPRVVGADVQISNLSALDVGRRVTVEAEIAAVDSFSAGIKCLLDDESGQITLLVWQNVAGAVSDIELFAAGARIRCSGWVESYRGELEIIPGLSHDIQFLGGPDTP
jgi:DNA/RNA endonuclease YhcR with UshA esterase domain